MEITFLGTSSMVPTKDRNPQAIFLKYREDGILLDCGEGTQRQMNVAGIKRTAVTKILISHWHGDHISGLVGFIQTLGNSEQGAHLKIYGPKGSKVYFGNLMKSCIFENQVDIELIELDPKHGELKTFIDNEHYSISCAWLDHSAPCLGYRFVEKDRRKVDMSKAKKFGLGPGPVVGKLSRGETAKFKGKEIKPDDVSYIVKGKVIAFILDTGVCDNCFRIADDADLLISECVYASDLKEKARDYRHLCADDATLIATKANVKKLILTHFSQRYKTADPIIEDAKQRFPDVEGAFDFMKVTKF